MYSDFEQHRRRHRATISSTTHLLHDNFLSYQFWFVYNLVIFIFYPNKGFIGFSNSLTNAILNRKVIEVSFANCKVVLDTLNGLSTSSTIPFLSHLNIDRDECSDMMVNSKSSDPGHPVMATQASGSPSKCPM